ncbi:hypothetical protein BDQ12DRAFT_97559 [Crucibulum laeve]|uniref:Uncharacterized protein n=1 Tax=Crucibulum laeve TaxID=68775 RepID=A0A5C3M0M2_9AGAR|nr:hypothetical protein BDQ12DRAFT_97559 [Crucibulum laeve]
MKPQDLPREILGEIFVCCRNEQNSVPSIARAPLLLCQVCSSWRSVTISTPEMWDTLSLVYDIGTLRGGNSMQGLGSSHEDASAAEIVKFWFGRSGIRPLSFILRRKASRGNVIEEALAAAIASFAGRFQHLELHVTRAVNLQPLFSLYDDGFEALNTLELRLESDRAESQMIITQFSLAPRLRRVVLCLQLPQISIPWAQITHLSIPRQSISSTDWQRMIRACMSLQVGIFSLYLRSDAISVTEQTTFPDLHRLGIWYKHRGTSDIFRSLTFPSLSDLRLVCSSDRIDSSVWHHNDHLSSQLHRVTHLTVSSLSLPTSSFPSMLLSASTVTHLTMNLTMRHKPFFVILTYRPSRDQTTCALPHLRSFHVHLQRMKLDIVPACVKMVQSRWKVPSGSAVSELNKVSFVFIDDREQGQQLRERLVPYAKRGLDITVEVIDDESSLCPCSLSLDASSSACKDLSEV